MNGQAANCQFCGAPVLDGGLCDACGMSPYQHQPDRMRWDENDADGEPLLGGTALRGGRYRLLKVIGRGGFSYTYEGFDDQTNQPVAVKELFPQGSRRSPRSGLILPTTIASRAADAHSSFLREAGLLQSIHHRNVVGVVEAFQQNGTAYVVMELLRGQDLSRVLELRQRLPWGEVLSIAKEMGAGLEAAHRAGLVHRDLKPANVMQTTDQRIVLIDFGAARSIGSDSATLSKLVVTDGYSAIEQYGHTQPVSVASDIYGMAASIYHLVIGSCPPPAVDRTSGMALQHPSEVDASIPRPFGDAVLEGMRLNAAERPRTVGEFLAKLGTTPQVAPGVTPRKPAAPIAPYFIPPVAPPGAPQTFATNNPSAAIPRGLSIHATSAFTVPPLGTSDPAIPSMASSTASARRDIRSTPPVAMRAATSNLSERGLMAVRNGWMLTLVGTVLLVMVMFSALLVAVLRGASS